MDLGAVEITLLAAAVLHLAIPVAAAIAPDVQLRGLALSATRAHAEIDVDVVRVLLAQQRDAHLDLRLGEELVDRPRAQPVETAPEGLSELAEAAAGVESEGERPPPLWYYIVAVSAADAQMIDPAQVSRQLRDGHEHRAAVEAYDSAKRLLRSLEDRD